MIWLLWILCGISFIPAILMFCADWKLMQLQKELDDIIEDEEMTPQQADMPDIIYVGDNERSGGMFTACRYECKGHKYIRQSAIAVPSGLKEALEGAEENGFNSPTIHGAKTMYDAARELLRITKGEKI